jgi:hypothetical protein
MLRLQDAFRTTIRPRSPKPSRRWLPLFDRCEERTLLSTGAIFTTTATGGTVNANIYDAKTDVYLNGGPQNNNSQGLPDGTYYFQVTDPSGMTLLSTDDVTARELQVVNGRVYGVANATSSPYTCTGTHANGSYNPANQSIPVQLANFADTPNAGGE